MHKKTEDTHTSKGWCFLHINIPIPILLTGRVSPVWSLISKLVSVYITYNANAFNRRGYSHFREEVYPTSQCPRLYLDGGGRGSSCSKTGVKVSICIRKQLMRNALDGRGHLHLVEVLSGYRSCGGCFDDPDFGKIVSKTGFLSASSN